MIFDFSAKSFQLNKSIMSVDFLETSESTKFQVQIGLQRKTLRRDIKELRLQ